jgi:SAM-dependent methyltransferase
VTDDWGHGDAHETAHPTPDHDGRHHLGHRHHNGVGGTPPGDPPSSTARARNAVSLVFGRGAMADCVAGVARLTPADRVVDIGCGPGTAVRVASRCCELATGVDPDPISLRLARSLNWLRRRRNARIVEGNAEALPLPDASATVVWAITSVHHWADRAAGLAEARRVLAPGGRVFLVEHVTPPEAHGHRRYGMTEARLDALESDATRAGFIAVRREMHLARRDTLAVVRGSVPAG